MSFALIILFNILYQKRVGDKINSIRKSYDIIYRYHN